MEKKLILCLLLIAFFVCSTIYLYAESKQQNYEIVLDETLLDGSDKEDILAAWLAYAGTRVLWHRETFLKQFPNEEQYLYTFKEELESRKALIEVWVELSEESKAKDEYLDELKLIYKNGYLVEYVFLYINNIKCEIIEDLRINEFKKWVNDNIPEHKVETLATISPAPK